MTQSHSWQQLSIKTTAADAETLAEQLETAGAVSVSLSDSQDEPIYEPEQGTTPLWQQVKLTALFAADVDVTAIIALLKLPGEKIILTPVAAQAWQENFQQQFQAQQFGRLWVIPSWCDIAAHHSPHIILDPGLAFGTGTHPTTALCLQWLAAHIHGGETVIDYGCGSGILAIAAATLGATKIIAVDNDPQALQATRDNAQRNQVKLITQLPETAITEQADIVIANILANPLISLAPLLIKATKIGGIIVLSGILVEQAAAVIAAYSAATDLQGTVPQENWVRLVLQRR